MPDNRRVISELRTSACSKQSSFHVTVTRLTRSSSIRFERLERKSHVGSSPQTGISQTKREVQIQAEMPALQKAINIVRRHLDCGGGEIQAAKGRQEASDLSGCHWHPPVRSYPVILKESLLNLFWGPEEAKTFKDRAPPMGRKACRNCAWENVKFAGEEAPAAPWKQLQQSKIAVQSYLAYSDAAQLSSSER